MEKERELKRMTIELPAYASNATQSLTRGIKCRKAKGWNFGRMPTEKRLPCYLNKDFYIPRFEEMTLEAIELMEKLNAGS